MPLKILDPYIDTFRGGGRIMQLLHENLKDEAEFVSNFDDSALISSTDTLLIPIWDPFKPLPLSKRIAARQILMIFDVIPFKFAEHFPSGLRGKLQAWKNRGALRHFDAFITISEHAKQDIVRHLGIPSAKIHVVYPTYARIFEDDEAGANKAIAHHQSHEVLEKYSVESGRFAMYVGDVNWNKNIVTLAKAIKIAHVPTLFVGKVFAQPNKEHNLEHPWFREFKQFKSETLGSTALFPGFVPDDELKILYQHAMCNILISRDEGFGMSYLEAATQKCPSILSDIPVFHEIALNTARYEPADDPQKIAQALNELQNSPPIRQFIGNEAQIRSKMFTPDRFKKDLLNII